MDAQKYALEYKKVLTQNVLPFWLEHGMDKKNGGIYTALDKDGSVLDSDKSVWFQGRAQWAFATAYVEIEECEDYLTACESLSNFSQRHCFDTDGRMFFRVSADGKPVIKRLRYFFSETFAIIGAAAYSRALQKASKHEDAEAQRRYAWELFQKMEEIRTSDVLLPKFNQENAPSRGFGVPMILLNTAQELRKALPEKKDILNQYIDDLLDDIKRYFIRPELKCVLEQCAPDGTIQSDHFEGRLLNPGHALEGSWFIMNEARYRNSSELLELGTTMLDWMWDIGWDKEYGGIIYFKDALNKSATEYWHDMKFWWPQCEAVIANLMAYTLTKNETYKERFILADEYARKNFLDTEDGEWYGYLHRDGRLSTPLKGNMYKGPFHIPRMYIVGCELLR